MIIIGVFLTLILLTTTVFGIAAYESYSYDMDPKNGVDLLEGVGAMMLIGIGSILVWYELDLMCTVRYFFCKEKTILKTLLHIFSNLSFALALVYVWLSNAYMQLRAYEEIVIVFVLIYLVLRIIYICLWASGVEMEE